MDVWARLQQLLQVDRRYKREAYLFIHEALSYAQRVLRMGTPRPAETRGDDPEREERHLTGQQLCDAIRLYAVDQFGYMAKVVLKNWGIRSTGDFGEIVYNLIDIGFLNKSPSDRRADFDNVYDFEEAFGRAFQITKDAGEDT